MKPKLDAALDSLLADGIIFPINNSKWAAPVMPVLKPDNTITVGCVVIINLLLIRLLNQRAL